MSGQEVFSHELPSAAQVPAARHALQAWLRARSVSDGLRASVALVANELVTNATQRARTGFTVTAEILEGGAVRIEVFDRDTRLPVAGLIDDDAVGGRGLLLVARIAADWGAGTAERDGIAGKTVWAVVDKTLD